MSTICVFCGSSSGNDSAYRDAATELGTAIAHGGHALVYGGGDVGLMGVVADAVLAAGGEVTGVITEQLLALEVGHDSLTALEVMSDMHTRKARMAELADGVVVLPGGFGTYEEAFEVLTWNQLGIVSAPIIFLDVRTGEHAAAGVSFFGALFDFIDDCYHTTPSQADREQWLGSVEVPRTPAEQARVHTARQEIYAAHAAQ